MGDPDPTPFPPWWPRDGTNLPRKKCYRAIRTDMDDFVYMYSKNVHSLTEHCFEMRELVLRAVAHGSAERSPFLHASWDRHLAHRWHQLAQRAQSRGEKEAQQILVEIDIWGWYKYCLSTKLRHQACIIDMSSHVAQKNFFDVVSRQYDMTGHGTALGQSIASQEVLLKWRGSIPMHFFTVLDPNTGKALGSLMMLMHTSKGKVRQLCEVFEKTELQVQANRKRPRHEVFEDEDFMACCEANKESYRQLKEERIQQDIKPEPIPPKPTRPTPSTSTREVPSRDVPRPSEAFEPPQLPSSFPTDRGLGFDAFILEDASAHEAPRFLLPLLLLPFLSLVLLLLLFLLPLPLGGGDH